MIRILLTALVPALIATSAFAAPKKVAVDTASSTVNWSGNKVFVKGGGHTGTVAISGGNLTVDGDKITGGEFTVDMTTIKNTDLKDAGMQGKLVGHLNSPDFFDTANFKDAKFVITKVTAGAAGEYTFDGNMTIRGQTNPQTVKATVKKDGKTWVATGKLKLDRTKYNVKYSSQTAFPDLIKKGKDKVIDDNIDLDFTVKTVAI